ncbi:hypothetical protein LJR044_003227 [Microbacterium foliorum]
MQLIAPSDFMRALSGLPKTIVYGAVIDVDDQAHDTPSNDPTKFPAET